MLKVDQIETWGWDAAIRGMRNPMNSWDKSDSMYAVKDSIYVVLNRYMVGANDETLMKRLVAAGPDHSKFMRMLHIQMDITAPMYWWKEFDTYRVGVAPNPTDIEYNSTSTMHKIAAKEFVREDFSCEHLIGDQPIPGTCLSPAQVLGHHIRFLNHIREMYLATQDKAWWWQLIQLLPSSYNYLRTIDLNYQAARHIYQSRRNHKLDEWKKLCEILAHGLPCGWLITDDSEDAE